MGNQQCELETVIAVSSWKLDAVRRVVRRELRRNDVSTPLGRRINRIRALLSGLGAGPLLDQAIAAELTASRPWNAASNDHSAAKE